MYDGDGWILVDLPASGAWHVGYGAGVFVAARVFHQSGSFALFAGAALLVPMLSSLFAVLLARHHRRTAAAIPSRAGEA